MTDTVAEELTGQSHLEVALAALNHFQQTVQQADGKANILAAIEAGVFSVLISQGGQLKDVGGGGRGVLTWIFGGLLFLLAAGSAVCLGQALRPRMPHARTANRFSYPGVAALGTPPTLHDPQVLAAEVWAVSELIARIAVTKNRYLNAGLALFGLAALPALALAVLAW
ncbi:hypothetical protein [Kineosporia babensis]|uniref:Pycsar effector protein domain-containing protein n=1 Tax=Kineosporia babensis TaxID=499548 RepID=A0A9X1NB94_9ACTN|nr:hypothetical protein [Kineosporia babensis]MCD5312047.1 hypothetical protein [Kineosporia babensis]